MATVTAKKKFTKFSSVSTKLGAKILVGGKKKSADSDPAFSSFKTSLKAINNLGKAVDSLNSQLVTFNESLVKTFKIFEKADLKAAKHNLKVAKLTADDLKSEKKKEDTEKNTSRRSLDAKSEERSEKDPLGIKPQEKQEKVIKPMGGFFDFLKDLLQLFVKYAITSSVLKWMMDPKNTEKVGKIFLGIQKVVKFLWNVVEKVGGFIAGSIITLGSGVFDTIDGLKKGDIGQTFQGLGQILTAIPGILALKWILNPMSLFKDIAGILGNESSFKDKGGKKPDGKPQTGVSGSGAGRTPTTTSAAARRYADRYGIDAARKRFGADAVKSLGGKYARSGFQNAVRKGAVSVLGKGGTKTALKIVRPFVKRLPIIGALLDFGLSVAMGEPLGRAAFKAIGAGILGAIGTGFGGPLGAILGGMAGDWAGGKLYDVFFGQKPKGAPKPGEFESGGIVRDGKKLSPQQVGGVLVDTTSQTLKNLGPGGKLADQMLGAEVGQLQVQFGKSGVLINQSKLRASSKKPSKSELKQDKTDEAASLIAGDTSPNVTKGQLSSDKSVTGLLASVVGVLGMLVNKDFNKGESGGGSTTTSTTSPSGEKSDGPVDSGGIEAASGSVVDKGVAIAKKFQSNLGLTKEAAAGIAGNFAHESGGFIPGIREGGPFGKSSKPWPKGTVGRGYGWAQWTNSRPGDRYDKFIDSYGGDYNKVPTNEDNFKFAVNEMKGPEPLSSGFKKMTDVGAAAVWFRKNWERAGVHHDGPRISYAKGILAKMASGGSINNPQDKRKGNIDRGGSDTEKKMSEMGYAKGGKIYLHWTAGGYSFKSKGHYHGIVQGDGSIYKAHPYTQMSGVAHTYSRNAGAVGLSLAAMGGNPDPWSMAPKDVQYQSLAKEIANIGKSWGWGPNDINIKNVMTHAEAASNKDGVRMHDNYGPRGWGGTGERWDLWQLKKGEPNGSGGDKLRAMARGFMGGDSTVKYEAGGANQGKETDSNTSPASSSSPSNSQQTQAAPAENWWDTLGKALSGQTAKEMLSGQTSTPSSTPTSTPSSTPSSNASYTPGTIPSSGSLNKQQLVSLALKVGFKGRHAAVAAAVAYAESTGNPMAHNKVPPDNSYGLWQINMIGNLGPARRRQWGLKSNEELFNPETNAKIAYKISGGVNFSAWTTFTGGKYKAHLAECEKALASMQTKSAAGGGLIPLNFMPDSSGIFNSIADSLSKNPLGTKSGKLTPMQQWAKKFPQLAKKVKPGQSGYDEIQSYLNPSPSLNFAKGIDTSKISYGSSAVSSKPKEDKKEVKLTPMQQWAKNFPELAKKVKPGQSGYDEIQAYLFPNKYADIAAKGFDLAQKGIDLSNIKPASTPTSNANMQVVKESPKLPDDGVYQKNKLVILNNFRRQIIPTPPPQVVTTTAMPQACYTSFFSN